MQSTLQKNTKSKSQIEVQQFFKSYSPSCEFTKVVKNFTITVAKNIKECEEIFRLRNAVFLNNDEFEQDSYEFDYFDMQADHLILKDNEQDQIIGTYRILSSDRTSCFYSQTEFEMTFINKLDGLKLEVGRACIHPDYRRGVALQLIWQGLAAYFNVRKPTWLFGCSSTHVETLEEKEILNTVLLEKYSTIDDYRSYSLNPVQISLKEYDVDVERKGERLIPVLLKYYLKLGASVCGEACWDPEFKTLDYLTLMHVPSIPEKYARKFGLDT